MKESHNTSEAYQSVTDKIEIQIAPFMYRKQVSYTEKLHHTEENFKSSVAAAMSAFTSSAHVSAYVSASFASDGVIVNIVKGPSNDHPPEKS